MTTIFAGLPVDLTLMRSIVSSAPQSIQQVADPKWQETSICARTLAEAETATRKASADVRADFEQCRDYWLQDFAALSDKTRGIITLSFSMLVRPFITRPMRKLFCTDTNVKPEDAFNGKVIIIDLPVQDFRLAGRVASLAWKYCYQVAVMRRSPPAKPNTYLRPVFLWADEAQNFITEFDAEYQAVARSAGGCTVYLTQNLASFHRVLGDSAAVESLLGNLQAKFFCQNAGHTNDWASHLLGERWVYATSTNVNESQNEGSRQGGGHSSGVTRSQEQRRYVEPSRFTTLKRGGPLHNFQVECIVYNGGHRFKAGQPGKEELLPYRFLTFNQL